MSYARIFIYECAENLLSFAHFNCAVFTGSHRRDNEIQFSASVCQALSSTGRWKSKQDCFIQPLHHILSFSLLYSYQIFLKSMVKFKIPG